MEGGNDTVPLSGVAKTRLLQGIFLFLTSGVIISCREAMGRSKVDKQRLPLGGLCLDNRGLKYLSIEDITLDTFLDAYRENDFDYLQGGFRNNGGRCPAAAVTDSFKGNYRGTDWPSYSYLVGLAHGSDGDPRDPAKPEGIPDKDWIEDHYHRAYEMGERVREAMLEKTTT